MAITRRQNSGQTEVSMINIFSSSAIAEIRRFNFKLKAV